MTAIVPLVGAVSRNVAPSYGNAVPSNRPLVRVTDGCAVPKVRLISSVGESVPLPIAVMIQPVLASVVVPVSVAAVDVRHPVDPPTRLRQMIVRPLVIVDLIAATTLPGPSVW